MNVQEFAEAVKNLCCQLQPESVNCQTQAEPEPCECDIDDFLTELDALCNKCGWYLQGAITAQRLGEKQEVEFDSWQDDQHTVVPLIHGDC